VRDPRERAGALPSYAKKGPPARDHAVRRRTSSSTVHQFVDGAPVRRPRTSSSTAHQYVALAPGATGAPTRKGCAVEERVRDRGKGAPSRKGCAVEERVRDAAEGGRAAAVREEGPTGTWSRGPMPHQFVDAAPVRRRRTSTSPSHRMQRVRRPGKGARSRKGCATEERVRDTAERASAPRKGCAAEDKGAGHGGGGARRRGGCAAEEEYGTRRRGRHARATRDGHARGALRSRVDAGRATALKGCSHG
jgi:hypothetical protein